MNDDFWNDEALAFALLLSPILSRAAAASASVALNVLSALSPSPLTVSLSAINENLAAWATYVAVVQALLITRTTRNRVDRVIRGEIPPDELPAFLDSLFGKDRAELIAIDQITRAFAQGTLETFSRSGIVRGFRVITSRDERVCRICNEAAANGPYSLSDVLHMPPLHGRCRCHLSPVI